jgi:acetyl-CoA carboxylase biotin carboxyl carrier protein
VREILRLVDESQLDEFELETPRITIRFRRGEASPLEIAGAVPMPTAQAPPGLAEVRAPMVGTFYRAPGPGEAPFVELGSAVEEDTQVCILEVMKLMSAVVAGTRGVVTEICCTTAPPSPTATCSSASAAHDRLRRHDRARRPPEPLERGRADALTR